MEEKREHIQEERLVFMHEENQLLDGTIEEKDRNGEDIIVENQVMKAEKVGEIETGIAKKQKQGSKQSLKAKPTVPQPFSLSTEKRMSKEKQWSVDFSSENMKRKPNQRHGSMDFNNSYSQPTLSRSVSSSHRSCRPPVRAAENIENRIWGLTQETMDKTLLKWFQSKHMKENDKKQLAEENKSSNLQKSCKFKALPLPRFYQKKDSPSKSETKKMADISKKSPLVGQKNRGRSISKAEKSRIENKGKEQSKTITNGDNGTISKLLRLRGTRKV
ncbi:hypothetical protein DITRI_Ditri04bG0089300 [Diplodiscus trichospermus]